MPTEVTQGNFSPRVEVEVLVEERLELEWHELERLGPRSSFARCLVAMSGTALDRYRSRLVATRLLRASVSSDGSRGQEHARSMASPRVVNRIAAPTMRATFSPRNR